MVIAIWGGNMEEEILFIDDSQEIVEAFKLYIDDRFDNKYFIKYRTNPEYLIDVLNGDPVLFPNLLIIDLHMGHFNTVKAIKRVKSETNIPVLILSNDPNAEYISIEIGANYYSDKNFIEPKLLKIISSLLLLENA